VSLPCLQANTIYVHLVGNTLQSGSLVNII